MAYAHFFLAMSTIINGEVAREFHNMIVPLMEEVFNAFGKVFWVYFYAMKLTSLNELKKDKKLMWKNLLVKE